MTVRYEKSLDLRTIQPNEREATVLSHLESMPLGEPLQIVAERKPDDILACLQQQYPSDFEWNVLEEGPKVWRVEISKRADEHYHGSMDLLGHDHQRLDSLFDRVVQIARRGAEACRGEASELFAEFRTGLLRHIRAEENVLFPVFEQRTGMTGGPVLVMKQEHRDIEGILHRATLRLEAGQPIDDLGEDLRSVLAAHNLKEEQVLYPMTDRHLDAVERADLIRKLQQV